MKPLFYSLEQLSSVITLSTATIQNLVRTGEFPSPRTLSGRRVGFRADEVDEWANSRPHSELLPPTNTGKRKDKASATD